MKTRACNSLRPHSTLSEEAPTEQKDLAAIHRQSFFCYFRMHAAAPDNARVRINGTE